MKFDHNWLPKHDVIRIENESGRFYQTPSGNQYLSVTSFLSRFSDNSFLDTWIKNVGEEEAQRVSSRAARRGTAFHSYLEDTLLNKQPSISNIIHAHQFNQFIPIVSRINNIRAIEYYLYSDVLKLAGAVDCIGEFDGVLSIIDFKTSSRLKSKDEIENYWLQTTIYSLMVEEMYGIKIENLVVLISVDLQKPLVYTENRSKYFPKLAELLKQRKALNA